MQHVQSDGMNVLVLCDPGLPSRRISSIEGQLEELLHEAFDPPVTLHTHTEVIRLKPDNTLDLEVAQRISDQHERIDVVLMLTEIPRHTEGKPLVAEIFPDQNVAVISCPTLGAWATKGRILTVFMDCVLRLAPRGAEHSTARRRLRWSAWSNGESNHQTLHAHTMLGGLRTVAGMTIANDPWRTSMRLSSALATAAATGAFGVFFNTIWQMAEYLSTLRLISIGALAIVTMTAWLIVSNRLWDRPVRERLSRVVLLYNLSTVLTMFMCVVVLYVVLLGLILTGGLIVIDPEFMSETIGVDASFSNYLDLAWLSAAMGVVAGALGSSFDSDTDLRRITHGQRERQRQYTQSDQHQQQGEHVDDTDTP